MHSQIVTLDSGTTAWSPLDQVLALNAQIDNWRATHPTARIAHPETGERGLLRVFTQSDVNGGGHAYQRHFCTFLALLPETEAEREAEEVERWCRNTGEDASSWRLSDLTNEGLGEVIDLRDQYPLLASYARGYLQGRPR